MLKPSYIPYLLFILSCFGYSQNLQWVKTITGPAYESFIDVEVDDAGNLYLAGKFTDIADLDPGPLNQYVTYLEGSLFLMKLNSNGNLVWVRNFGSHYYNLPQICLDDNNNIFFYASFWGTEDFDPGPDTTYLTSNTNNNDFFISKFDTDGNFLWVKQIMVYSLDPLVNAQQISITPQNNFIITGNFTGLIDFDPGPGVTMLDAGMGYNSFVSHYDNNGNLITATLIPSCDYHSTVAGVDSLNNIYVAGTYTCAYLSADTGSASVIVSNVGSGDIFISKIDSNGNYKWLKSIGSEQFDSNVDMVVNDAGTIYLTGNLADTTDIDPGTDTVLGRNGIFVLSLNANGDFNWGGAYRGFASTRSPNISIDASGNAYVSGTFANTVDFDPGIGVNNLTSKGLRDGYVSKFSSTGNYMWTYIVGDTLDDEITGFVFNNANEMICAGTFNGAVDFDPGAGIMEQYSWGEHDAFVTKINPGTIGINEMEDVSGTVLIYPNPASSSFQILTDQPIEKVICYNMLGTVCLLANNTNIISTENLASGTYSIFIQTGNGVVCKKLVVQH